MLVVAFDSTASALAFASSAKSCLSGRLIPVPRSLSAGCGIAWRESLGSKDLIESLIQEEGIDDARIVQMKLV